MTARDARARVEQPAPAGNDELPYAHQLTAEQGIRYLREEVASLANRELLAGAARAVVADYDERGRELERLRAQVADLDVTALVAKYRAKSAEYLEDWQDWDSHDGHQRCGQGIAYSDVADELEALLGVTTNEPEEGTR